MTRSPVPSCFPLPFPGRRRLALAAAACVYSLLGEHDRIVASVYVPWYVLLVGVSGSLFGLCFQIWAMRYDTPFVLAGKPYWSIPAFVPVWYEATILSCCLTIFFGNWIFNRLPRLHHPLFSSKAFERVTDDKFFVIIESTDPKFDNAATRALLQETGAVLIEEVQDQ